LKGRANNEEIMAILMVRVMVGGALKDLLVRVVHEDTHALL